MNASAIAGLWARPVLRRAVLRHVLITATIAVALSTVLIAGIWAVWQSEGHRTARQISTQVAGALIVDLSATDFSDRAVLDRTALGADVAPYLESGLVHRIKVWRVEGDRARVVFSDEPRIEDDVRSFDPVLARRLDAGEPVSLSLPVDDEHRYELADGAPLIEVYIGFRDAAGTPMRLEIYVPIDTGAATARTVAHLVPLTLAALLALGAATIPLTISFARRMEGEQEERRAALRYGLAASDLQRRELAQLLHDGVIQDLAGAGILLDAIRQAEDAAPGDDSRRPLLEKAHRLVADDIRQLRILAADLLPVAFDGANLHAAITGLVQQLGDPRVDVAVDVEDAPTVAHDRAVLLHRAARELLRNAYQHSGASRIRVHVAQTEHGIELQVADNGVGFEPARPASDGHIGLKLVGTAVEESGGSLDIATAPGHGTRVSVILPDLAPGSAVPPTRRSQRLRCSAGPEFWGDRA